MIENLTIQTKLTDPVMPTYGTNGSVGLDFPVQSDIYIPPHGKLMVELHFNVLFPEGTWGLLVARSSLQKKGLMLANSVGVVDNDYRGPDDTLKAILVNLTDQAVYISQGERIVQLILMPTVKPEYLTVDFIDWTIEGDNRGGFGSTG